MVFSILSVVLVLTFLVAVGILYRFANQTQTAISSELEKSLNALEVSLTELRDALAEEQSKVGSFAIDIEEEASGNLQTEEPKTKTVRLDDGLEYEIVGGL